jgi:hypothetical protein
MRVENGTYFKLIAIGFHTEQGYGDDVEISPYETKIVNGPYLGQMDGGDCYVAIPGKLTCHTGLDNGKKFHIGPGKPVKLIKGKHGIHIRHHEDPEDPHVL